MNYRYNNNPLDPLDLRNEEFGVTKFNGRELTIPNAENNIDWQEFRDWEEEGNNPQSAPLIPLDDYKLQVIRFINSSHKRIRLSYTEEGGAQLTNDQRNELDTYDSKGGRLLASDVPLMENFRVRTSLPNLAAVYDDWDEKRRIDNVYLGDLENYSIDRINAVNDASNHREVQNIAQNLSFPTSARRRKKKTSSL